MSSDPDDSPGSTPTRGGLLGADELAAARTGISSFVRERVASAGANGVVVGLSGGVDSTLTALLAVEALGSECVVGLSMPCDETTGPARSEARTIADGLGIEFHEVGIGTSLDRLAEAAPGARDATDVPGERPVPGEDPERRDASSRPSETDPRTASDRSSERVRGNAAARLRMATLYYAANARSLLVLGTANRTELLTGYFTKHGDGGADLFPLGGLYKTEVRTLARSAGVPRRIVAKPPTAGFWEGQTDESDLGARYETIDRLVHRVVDEGAPADAAIRDLSIDRADATDLLGRVTDTDHKRRRPPVYPIADRPPAGGRTAVERDSDDAPPADRFGPPSRWHAASVSSPARPAPGLGPGVDRDALFEALADERRRAVLGVLYDRGESVSLSDLVTAVVDRTTDRPHSTVSPSRVEQLSVALPHIDLPRLRDAGVLEFDRQRETVELTPLGDELRPMVAPLLA